MVIFAGRDDAINITPALTSTENESVSADTQIPTQFLTYKMRLLPSRGQHGRLRAAAKHSGIGNVWEGPLIESLADVFRQMEEKGIGRRSEG